MKLVGQFEYFIISIRYEIYLGFQKSCLTYKVKKIDILKIFTQAHESNRCPEVSQEVAWGW